ncbi:MAG: endo-1,4-beta-xylanase [Bacteroidetes bacterium]|nr:endo-1,4-beta-xylanase [Bacteroidota bacterium]
MAAGEIIFKPYFVQKGRGPHIIDKFLSFDINGDPFKSDIILTNVGIKISDTKGNKFGISVRWNVEGYGFLYMPCDNAGEFYEIEKNKELIFNLNYELLKTRVERNRKRLNKFRSDGWKPSVELNHLLQLGDEYLSSADNYKSDNEICAQYSQTGLKHAVIASEQLEIEKSKHDVLKNGYRKDFLFGCDARGYFQMDSNLFLERFTELFNYSTITHYLIGDVINFEPVEGKKQFSERDKLLDELLKRNIKVEGRPLFWSHFWVSPDWLKKKNYDELKKYVEKHVREVISHYGDRILTWEIVNEMHDWANEVELNQEQTIELTKFACEVAKDTNPKVQLLVNNCCPFADYVQLGKWGDRPALYPQRTPHQFTKQLVDAGVNFDIIGMQVYFVHRTLTEALQAIERYKVFNKRVQLAEIGSPSRGITQEFVDKETEDFSKHPYEWRRHWDEELQADWLEYVFTYGYSQPFIEAANWYDFVDPMTFLKSGGLLRSDKGEKKAAVDRLLKLQNEWKKLK